jgi:hypothetical protein
MNRQNKAPGAGGRSGAADFITALNRQSVSHSVADAQAGKNGRSFYVRFFQDRLLYVSTCLRPDFFIAWIRLTVHYVRLGGNLPDNDAELARLAQLTPKRWRAFRDEVLKLGLVEIRDGRWVDPDQDRSIANQRRASEHGRRAIQARWNGSANRAA